MVRVMKKRNNLNEISFTSKHYDSPVTRSQTAVLDLFKNFSNNSNMFSDPAVRSVLEEEMTRNPGRVMTRHMVTYRPKSEIENLAKLAKQRKCRDIQQSGISSVVKNPRVSTRMPRVKKRSDSARGRRWRSRSIVYNRNSFPKRKRKGIDHIRITINDIAKKSMKPLNVIEIQSQAGQEKDASMAYETKLITDSRDIFHGDTLDGLQDAVNRLEIGKQEDVQTRQIWGNGISPSNVIISGREQVQFYPSRNFENNISSKKAVTFGTVYDGFNASQPNKNEAEMKNNIMRGQNHHKVYASRTLEKGTPLWNDARFGKQANILTSGSDAEQDIRNRGFKTATAQETLKTLPKNGETGIHCKHVYDCFNNENREMKLLNDCEKPKSVSLWFGNAVSSVSSYVTKYMPFKS